MTIDDRSRLASLGWDAGWAAAFHAANALGARDTDAATPARVVAEHRERYIVNDGDGDYSAVLAGRVRHEALAREQLPAVGDWVGLARGAGDGTRVI